LTPIPFTQSRKSLSQTPLPLSHPTTNIIFSRNSYHSESVRRRKISRTTRGEREKKTHYERQKDAHARTVHTYRSPTSAAVGVSKLKPWAPKGKQARETGCTNFMKPSISEEDLMKNRIRKKLSQITRSYDLRVATPRDTIVGRREGRIS
jgi:hypothetical protein